jgi:hypothetical protein
MAISQIPVEIYYEKTASGNAEVAPTSGTVVENLHPMLAIRDN